MSLKDFPVSSLFSTLRERILDLFFPVFCLGCGEPREFLCDHCLKRISLRQEHHCPRCEQRITPYGELCPNCFRRSPLDGVFAATTYRIPVITRAVHTFKYRFVPALSVPLSTLLSEALRRSDLPLPDIILPVPLHKRRLRFRGFNQSELLAHRLGEIVAPGLSLPVLSNSLLRVRFTRPQIQTESRAERLHNLKNAFVVPIAARDILRGKNIWLIDDIATTSATLEECARTLKQVGAAKVFGIVIAR